MIERLHLERFGPFEVLDLTFPQDKREDKAQVHIFTGPNGCGKTTLLRAMSCFRGMSDGIYERFWDNAGWAGLYFSVSNESLGVAPVPRGSGSAAMKEWVCRGSVARTEGEAEQLYFVAKWHTKTNATLVYVFAYSGHRSLKVVPLKSLSPVITGDAREDAHFTHSENSEMILQWVANQRTSQGLALINGEQQEAEQYARNIARLEHVIHQITGMRVEFKVENKPVLRVVANLQGKQIDLELFPDGLKSIFVFIADLLMRLDVRGVQDPFNQEMVLLLDEIDIHLHPKWQRSILRVIQSLFINAQIFISTHSPFVVGSVSDAWVYTFKITDSGQAELDQCVKSKAGSSVSLILDEIFDVGVEFDIETEAQLGRFYTIKTNLLSGDESELDQFLALAKALSAKSLELRDLVGRELRQLSRIAQKDYRVA